MTFELTQIEANLEIGLDQNYALMAHVGLLSETDRAEVERLLDVAHIAHGFPSAHQAEQSAQIAQAAERAIDAEDTNQALGAEVSNLATGVADKLAKVTWLKAVKAARAIAFARVDEVPATINDEFAALVSSAEVLAGELVGVTDAETAIKSGKAEQWSEIGDLRDTYQALTSWVSALRSARLIPASIPSDSGPHWDYRRPGNKRGHQQAVARQNAGDGGRALFLHSLSREPYVPASREEARAVWQSWQDEAAA